MNNPQITARCFTYLQTTNNSSATNILVSQPTALVRGPRDTPTRLVDISKSTHLVCTTDPRRVVRITWVCRDLERRQVVQVVFEGPLRLKERASSVKSHHGAGVWPEKPSHCRLLRGDYSARYQRYSVALAVEEGTKNTNGGFSVGRTVPLKSSPSWKRNYHVFRRPSN